MKYYDKKIYELNKTIEELAIMLVALVMGYLVGFIAGSIQTDKLQNEIEQYKFNEYVIEQSINDEGYGKEK